MTAKDPFQIYYRDGSEQSEYQPDFVAETTEAIHMLESKARSQMNDRLVLAKKEAALQWCELASNHNRENGGKPWTYTLIPHDGIAET